MPGYNGQSQAPIPSSPSQSLAMDPSSFQVLFNTLHPPEDHTFVPGAMGGKIPGFVYGQAGPSNTSLGETQAPYDFDPTQFISALSSQLPQIEDESPFDERVGTVSGGSGPTPDMGEQASRKGKERANDGEGSKIVKVTWWRPHGAVSPA
jgi:hypothetical protein